MEVAAIAEKSLRKASNKTQGAHLSLSGHTDTIYHGHTTTTGLPQLQLIIDYKLKIITKGQVCPQYKLMKAITETMDMLLKKYYAQTLYVIYEIGFASKHMIRQKGRVLRGAYAEDIIMRLESENMIRQVGKWHEEHEIIRRFWKKTYPNTPTRKKVNLYCITNEFKPVMEGFSAIIESRFFSRLQISNIYRMRREYEQYAEGVKKNLKLAQAVEAQKLGNCIECGRVIKKGQVKTKDYYCFNAGIVCHSCKTSYFDIKGGEWNLKSK